MASTPYTVADVMTKKVVAVTRSAEFKEIVTAIERWKVTALPVIEGEGRVVGVVSEADHLPKEEFHEHRPGMIGQMRRLADASKAGSTCAEDLMTTPAVTVQPGAALPQAARLMAERHIKRLPAVDTGGPLKGIVSRADLLKVFLRSDDALAAEISHEAIEQLFPVSRKTVKVDVTHGASRSPARYATHTASPRPPASLRPQRES
ncbi:CBS domain-containing protein [Streptomyces sp. NPDC097981]|uniref:CBS domain-containing protein n=1 Tax=Streptomyces sp. NPDC097981 TaxID=3155428 RepID=UPI00331EDA8E